ncbi:MAG: GtrA family protein [Cyclobacteriaceae bacterium]|nr:GtrA family protein [Cyclobacteriaceae bacterium]
MRSFLKSQIVSITATAVDFLVTVMVVKTGYTSYGLASGLGNIAGGITSFLCHRWWVFNENQNRVPIQAGRYVLVWCGYLILSVLVMETLTYYFTINYILVKILLAVALNISYNYWLYKKYVFK